MRKGTAARRDLGVEWVNISIGTRRQGLRLDIMPGGDRHPPVHSKAAGLYMICTLSRQHAEGRGYDDALMLDWRGQVAEGPAPTPFSSRMGPCTRVPIAS
jgi:branched-subunit amino acid aminotransferase/4-amino-4-deoxychorismate lyase